MSPFEIIKNEFEKCLEKSNRSSVVVRLASGQIQLKHYQSLLRQIYYQTRENPQIQALATMYFRGYQREAVSGFLRHALSEVGHDQLALTDLRNTGLDVSTIPSENPLPATSALVGFAFYQICNLNVVGYLVYLFFLEFMPTSSGKNYQAMFKNAGVPDNAFSFITDHTVIDIGHNKLMECYAAQLIKSKADLDSVLFGLRATAYLYEKMVESAFDWADTPEITGLAHHEYVIGN